MLNAVEQGDACGHGVGLGDPDHDRLPASVGEELLQRRMELQPAHEARRDQAARLDQVFASSARRQRESLQTRRALAEIEQRAMEADQNDVKQQLELFGSMLSGLVEQKVEGHDHRRSEGRGVRPDLPGERPRRETSKKEGP